MALPKAFDSAEKYFDEVISFFQEYQTFFNFRNTRIITENVLEEIKVDNLEELDLFNPTYDINLSSIPSRSLNDFFTKLTKFLVYYDDFDEDTNFKPFKGSPSPKKCHEIIQLTHVIKKLSDDGDFDTVVDFGSGLGYLDQMVYEETNFNILGLESKQTNCKACEKRQKMYYPDSLEKVKYETHIITEESTNTIEKYLEQYFPDKKGVCIAGLHACADLSIIAMKIFLKLDYVKALAIMPCCHHLMSKQSEHIFSNFPLSETMKYYYHKYEASSFMQVPFLRLGSEAPRIGDSSLENVAFCLVARGLLEDFCAKQNCKVIRNSRKAVKTKTLSNNLDKYFEAAATAFLLKRNEDNVSPSTLELKEEPLDITKLKSFAQSCNFDENLKKKAGLYIHIQRLLQPVIENFILFDRLMFLKENGITNCKFQKIFNEQLSPRAFVLIATK